MTSTITTSASAENFVCRNLEQLLRKHFGNEFTLIEYKTERLVPLGENFASVIIKIDVKARHTRHSDPVVEDFYFAGKVMVPDNPFFEKLEYSDTLNKEVFMYTDIIPLYVKIEREGGFAEKECISHLVPQIYGHRLSLDPNATKADKDSIILMENLKVQNYYVMDKAIGLDLEHAMCAIKCLSRFHALGIAARRKYPAEFKSLSIQTDRVFFDFEIINQMMHKFIDYMQREPRLAVYFDRVVPIINHLRHSFRYEERRHELWSTIVHNDLWTNNIMFHKDDVGRPDDVKFIDFQAYVCSDVFVDLSYFLCTSLNDEVTAKHFDELINVYYGELEFILKRLGIDVAGYSKKAFDDRYRQVAGYDMPRNILAMIFFTAGLHNARNSNDVARNIFSWKGNEQLFQKVLRILRIFEERDWLH